MPWIIDYQIVLERLTGQGLRCNYHNSGAFGFGAEAGAKVRGWIGPGDETIKPAALALARGVAAPYEENLANLCTQIWQTRLAGNVWLMPMSHWAYELNFGSRDWLPALIENIGVDPGLLSNRNNAAAIEFSAAEVEPFRHFIRRLLEMLLSSDFLIAFPGRAVVCTLHHHKQLWWVSTDEGVMEGLDELVSGTANPGGAPDVHPGL